MSVLGVEVPYPKNKQNYTIKLIKVYTKKTQPMVVTVVIIKNTPSEKVTCSAVFTDLDLEWLVLFVIFS